MFKCANCWYSTTTKLWKCPSCHEFGSFMSDMITYLWNKKIKSNKTTVSWNHLNKSLNNEIVFWEIKNKELNRIFQRGIKKWWVYLLWWEPWIWKSTIIVQIINELKIHKIKIWYFTWEENVDQIVDRIKRLKIIWDIDNVDNLDIFHSTRLEDIITTIEINKYDMIIIDSIQTIYSETIDSPAWSVNQVKQCSEKISEFCKNNMISVFIIWHVTKSWEIAWPKYLEHIVDVVLYLEWDRFGQYRFLRNQKNRFASTDEVAIFEMSLTWLKPVYDMKERIINSANSTIPGSLLTIWLDNARPVLVGLEVLLNKTKFKFPERKAIWIDWNRLNLIIAILERYLNLNLGLFDVFVNIPGEFKLYDSGLDLAVAVGIYSQYKNLVIDKRLIFLGEVWLWWQVLKSKLHEKRIKELPNWFSIIDADKIKNIVDIGKNLK